MTTWDWIIIALTITVGGTIVCLCGLWLMDIIDQWRPKS